MTAVTMVDDDLFTRAISGYRDAFLVQLSHLPESKRNELWSQRLSQFMPVGASGSNPIHGPCALQPSPLEKTGKRMRQDIPRTLPSGSGLPMAKRRATTPDSSVTVDLTRDLSHASSPAAPELTRQLSRTNSRKGSSPLSGIGSSSRHTAMVRSQSQQTPVSHRRPLAASVAPKRQSLGSQGTPLRLDNVDEYSPYEYTRQCLDEVRIPDSASALSLALSGDLASAELQQFQQPQSFINFGGLADSPMSDQPAQPGSSAVEMSRSTTTESLCGGIGMIRFDSTGSNLPPNFHFPFSSDFVPTTSPVDVPFPTSLSHTQRDVSHVQFPFSDSSPHSLSTSAPPATSYHLPVSAPSLSPSSAAVEMKHSMSAESNSSSFSQQSRAARRTQEQIVQGTRPIAPKLKSHNSSPPKLAEQHKMIRISSSDGTSKEVAAIPKASIQRPPRAKTYCTMCNDQPDGFHGEHELRRHIERVHSVVRKVWVCVDISPDKTFLANCKACRNGKRYGANYNAAAHLRRTHFNPCQRGRGGRGKDSEKRGGKGGGNHPPMEVLKHWMVQKEEIVLENAQNYIDKDALDDEIVAPAQPPLAADDTSFAVAPEMSMPSNFEGEDLTSLGLEPSLLTSYDAFVTLQTMNMGSSFDSPFYVEPQQMPAEVESYVS